MNGLFKMNVECVSEEVLSKIHETSIHILENKGVIVHHKKLRNIALRKGARVEGETVFFSRKLVEEALKKSPAFFELNARNKAKTITIGNQMVFSPVHGVPYIIDKDGTRRKGTFKDWNDLIMLTHQLNSINLTGAIVVEPNDIPKNTRHVELLYNLFHLTDKPLIFVAGGEEKSKDIIDMTAIVFGGKENLMKNPGIILSVNPVSPLRWDELMAGTILEFARNRQPVVFSPCVLMGASGPITPLGTCIIQNTEILSGITLAQMVNDGTPVVYCPASASLHMMSGNFVVGSPESILMNLAAIQMAKYYRLPCRIQAALTDSKALDYQAGYEATFSLILQVLTLGKNAYLSQSMGQLNSYMSSSFEKFVIDEEILDRLVCILRGLDTTDESYALDVIMDVGCQGNYLEHSHTFKHFRERWEPTIANWDLYEEWEKEGCPSIVERAYKKGMQLLDTYVAPPLDPEVGKELRAFMGRFQKTDFHKLI